MGPSKLPKPGADEVVDRRGVASFILITFSITYAIEGALIAGGLRLTGAPPLYGQLVIAGVMWVPALAVVLTVKLVTREGFSITNFRIGKLRPYLTSALLIPACFVVTYAFSWLIGLAQPDWGLADFRSLMASGGADTSTMPSPALILPALFLASLFVGPTVNGVFGLGEEIGWRGYLLPKLMPLGKVRAYAIVGAVWGLWHAPLVAVGFNYPGFPILGMLAMVGLTTALGVYINELTLRNRSSILAGWIHGTFNGQAYGIWRLVFPRVNPLLGGITGLVGILFLLTLGVWQATRGGRSQSKAPLTA